MVFSRPLRSTWLPCGIALMRRLSSVVAWGAFALSLLMYSAAAFAEKRVALVVGNGAYQHAAPLPNPMRDAKAIAQMFQMAGFDTVLLRNDVGNLEFKRALRDFFVVAKGADIAVVFFAGHGIQIADQNYLIPVDAKLAQDYDVTDEAISLDRIIEAIEPAARLRLVVLDACRDNPFLVRMQRRGATRQIVSRGLSKVEPILNNTLIAYAAKAGSTAEDGPGENSPFTTALIKHVAEPGLDIRLALGRVRDEVLRNTRNDQEPVVYGSLGGGSVSLVPAIVVAKPAAPAEVRADYELVERINTRKAWELFINQYKSGMYVDLARERLRMLEREEAAASSARMQEENSAWDRIKDSEDTVAIRRFIERHKSSPHAITAQNLLESLDKVTREKAEKASEEAKKQAEAKKLADEKAAAEATRLAEEKAAAEAERVRKAEEVRQQAEAKKLADEKAAAEAKRVAEEKAAAEAERVRKAEEVRQQAEAKKLADEKAAAEAKRLAEEKAAAEAERLRKAEEVRQQVEAKRLADEKAAAEAKRLAEEKAAADAERVRKAEEARKQAEAKKLAEEKAAAAAKKLAEEKAAAEAERLRKAEEAKHEAEAKEKAAATAKKLAQEKAAAEAERLRHAEEARKQEEAKRLAEENSAVAKPGIALPTSPPETRSSRKEQMAYMAP